MGEKKRHREVSSSQDIRVLFQQAKERREELKPAQRRGEPFFLQRILCPRILHSHHKLGGGVRDPTHLLHETTYTAQKRPSLLGLPERLEDRAQVSYYEERPYGDLPILVSPEHVVHPSLSPVLDIVFDMQEEFSLVCQPKCLTAYSTEKWMQGNAWCEDPLENSPLVMVHASRSNSTKFKISNVQFVSSSLHIVAGYHHAPMVDLFDLEVVDETTCSPQESFHFTGVHADGSLSGQTFTEDVYASDVVPVTNNLILAALSSGHSVWLDRRSGKCEICTGVFMRQYCIGKPLSSVRGRGPLTAAAFLCRDDPVNVLCGTQTGAVQLWDVRCGRECVATHEAHSAVSRLQLSHTSLLRQIVWLNTYAGTIQGLCVGHSNLQLLAEASCRDVTRTSQTFHLPSPRIALMSPTSLMACPHISTNSLLVFDVNGLIKKLSFSGNEETFTHFLDSSVFGRSNDDESNDCPIYSQAGSDAVEIPCRMMSCRGFPNISAAGVWNRYGHFVVGDTEGRVRIL